MQIALIQKKKQEGEREITLRLLEHLADGYVSQDSFAKQVGIAKGLANAYFNRCLHKGWIKLRQVPRRRYLYYLTPKGFAEKARLTAHFLSNSYEFYREGRVSMRSAMMIAADAGHARLGVLGDGELAEIAAIVSDEVPVEIVGYLAPNSKRRIIAQRPVVTAWDDLDTPQAALLATLNDPKATLNNFRLANPAVPVHVPSQLNPLVLDYSK